MLKKDKAMVIDVWYKTGRDGCGERQRPKRHQGFEYQRGVEDVRTGMRYHLEGVTRRDVAEKIALGAARQPPRS